MTGSDQGRHVSPDAVARVTDGLVEAGAARASGQACEDGCHGDLKCLSDCSARSEALLRKLAEDLWKDAG